MKDKLRKRRWYEKLFLKYLLERHTDEHNWHEHGVQMSTNSTNSSVYARQDWSDRDQLVHPPVTTRTLGDCLLEEELYIRAKVVAHWTDINLQGRYYLWKHIVRPTKWWWLSLFWWATDEPRLNIIYAAIVGVISGIVGGVIEALFKR